MSNIPTLEFTLKFINGLKEYNISYNDIINGVWKYCGGDSKHHKKYFELQTFYKSDKHPPSVCMCICGHKIIENCYITDETNILVLGNCCIKRFIPKSGRTCDKCGESHRNRIINRCNTCRKKTFYKKCNTCERMHNDKYTSCYSCNYKNK